MDFDQDVANWVLESYLRQPIDYKALDSVLNSLPLPRENPKLQKLVLLKKLESEVSERPVSETTLELMERLEKVAAVSDAMRRAYCAVAVDCTLRRVDIGGYEFFERVKRVWRSRIGRMKKNAAERGLGSDLLWEWKQMMETAVFDEGVAESVLKKFEGVCAVEAVMVYLREETGKMTPTFLELVADATKIDPVLQKIMGVNMIHPVAGMAYSGSNSDKDKLEMPKPRISLRDKLLGMRGNSSRKSRGVKIADSEETAGGPSTCRNHSYSAEMNTAPEALKLSSLKLLATLKHPLPDALRVAEAISNEARQHEPAKADELLIIDADGVVHSSGATTVNNAPKPNLMERNSSARTLQWDDSIDGSQEDVACRVELRVPSQKRRNTSPLRIYEGNNKKKRRPVRRWSLREEETLREAVEECGEGNWKVILNAHLDIFEGRTQVDLKDKWRNML